MMIYARNACLAGLFLALAAALVGFFGLFFAMGHGLVIPPAKRCQGAVGAVAALPNSRARAVFCFFLPLF